MDIRFVGVYYAKHRINQNSGFTWIRVCSPFNVMAVNDTAVTCAQVRAQACVRVRTTRGWNVAANTNRSRSRRQR